MRYRICAVILAAAGALWAFEGTGPVTALADEQAQEISVSFVPGWNLKRLSPAPSTQREYGIGWNRIEFYTGDGCRQTEGPITWMKMGPWLQAGGKWTGSGITSTKMGA